MVIYTIFKKDPRLMTPDNFRYVGKPMLITKNAKIAIRHFINQHYPDAGQFTDFSECHIPVFRASNKAQMKILKNGGHILFYRAGGAGDILMIAPLLQALKKKFPKVEISFAMDKKFFGIGRLLPCIDHLETFPIIEDTYKKYDMYASFFETIELHSIKARTIHGVDLFADRVDWEFGPDDPKTAILDIPKKAHRRVSKLMVREAIPKDAQIAVVQFRASNVNRAYDLRKMADVIGKLGNRPNTHVLVVGGKPDECRFQWREEQTGNLFPTIHKVLGELTWQETAALVSRADICIAPDSALVHLAGALNVPSLGLYGPFPSRLRTTYYPKCAAIESTASCSPCYAHGSWACTHLAKRLADMKDDEGNVPAWAPAPCWDSVSVESVITTVAKILDHDYDFNEGDTCRQEEF